MMKLLIVACLVAVYVAAAPPEPPKFPSTFCAKGEVTKHIAGETLFGTFMLCRDQVKQLEVLGTLYKDTKDSETRLLRYDESPKHMAYFVRGKEGGQRCITEERNMTSKLPEFFDWVNVATYEGIKKVREINYNLWGLTVGDVRFEVLVDREPEKDKAPVYYNRRDCEDFMEYTVTSFDPSTPDPSMFEIPKACK